MAKKGINSRVVAGIIGAFVILVVVVPVVLLVLDNDIVTQVQDPPLEIPFPIPDQPIDPNTPTIIEGDEGCIDGECIPIENPDVPFVPPEEEEETDEAINMTETSTDPPITQVCDILNLFCGTAKTVELEANIVKIDSTGNRFNETLTFDVPLASLFVEEQTDIDFRTGFIELGLNLISEPNTSITANGEMDVLINNNTILTQLISLSANGITDQDGRLQILFEFVSPDFTLTLDQQFNKFPDEQISKLSYVITDLSMMVETEGIEPQRNGLTNQEIFNMDIFRDDIQIFIIDTQGNQVRSYPQDDRLSIVSQSSTLTCRSQLTDPTGGGSNGVKCRRCTVPSARTCAIFDAPSVSKINVLDSNGQLVDAGQGTGALIDVMLLRNANYTVDHGVSDGSLDPFSIETPKSQKDYSYKIYNTGTKTWKKFFTTACTIYCMSWWQESWNGDTIIVSNFPK